MSCDVMVLSRAKSGRTWLRVMLSRLYQQHFTLDEAQLIELDNFHRQASEVPKIFFTHGHYLSERFDSAAGRLAFGQRKLLFLVRHPCDVAVSEFFQATRRATPHKQELHRVDGDQTIHDFVSQGPLGIRTVIDYLNRWAPIVSSYENTLMVRYEDLRRSPVDVLTSIVKFLEGPFSADEINSAAEFGEFDNLKELERRNFFKNSRLAPRDPTDPDSFKVRRGVVGGYRDYFSERQAAEMDQLVAARLSPFYGYDAEADAGVVPHESRRADETPELQ